jgi:hypothetical protein
MYNVIIGGTPENGKSVKTKFALLANNDKEAYSTTERVLADRTQLARTIERDFVLISLFRKRRHLHRNVKLQKVNEH